MARSRPRPTASSAEHRHDAVVVDRVYHQAPTPTTVRSQSFPAPAVSGAAGSKRCSPFPTRPTTRFRGKPEYTALEEEGTMTADRGNLEAIRSERIGWRPLGGGGSSSCLNRPSEAAPALYAAAIGGTVMVVRKNVRTLVWRFSGSREGSGMPHTNIRVRNEFRQPLRQGRNMNVPGCRDSEPRRPGRSTVDLPTAFEDDIVSQPNLPWIGTRNPLSDAKTEPVLAKGTQQAAATPTQDIPTAFSDRTPRP